MDYSEIFQFDIKWVDTRLLGHRTETFWALALRQSNSLNAASVPNLFLFGFFFSLFSFLYDNIIAIRCI